MHQIRNVLCALCFLCGLSTALAQYNSPTGVPTSVDARIVLDAAGPLQRKAIANVYLIACPKGASAVIGTGFLLNSGVLVTNAHVTDTCDATNLVGVGVGSTPFGFSKVIKDQKRDLALLVPKVAMAGGFKLAKTDVIPPGTAVSTWGYPFGYNGTSPLLSVGYVSGYREVGDDAVKVKHIVVNGAFNHGNSGGPLLISQQDDVIGIVVMTFHFYPPGLKQSIDALSNASFGLMFNTTEKNADGSAKTVSEAQITAAILEEFYEKTQVMIGEAISVSELKSLLQENAKDLPKIPQALAPASKK